MNRGCFGLVTHPFSLVAKWIHFTFLGILLPTIKLKVCTLGGLMNSATKFSLLTRVRHTGLAEKQGFP